MVILPKLSTSTLSLNSAIKPPENHFWQNSYLKLCQIVRGASSLLKEEKEKGETSEFPLAGSP
jgi:hypothetical protein